ncbi:thiamine pyrophosphate-dependent enzyme [Rhodococcus tukisamuensis]|uniref:2-oxoisovalerate dehydrogenase E1 component n=1 Tax=Rhodococcus tukisamuensis TaxID=168276 RepID=A0A1G7DNW4_9NOCA|nr:thiamine pyrophosphate-dependent enzyme [Rhodococcus tukisamuensis]SDE53233.1 2-oxoisovalerate dehydrogenase E1 component [Rhodococcus tukisamuensis]
MAESIDEQFVETVGAMVSPTPGRSPAPTAPVREGSALTAARCLELFDAQLGSRHLDLAARELRARGQGYYTIGSAGHESNAAVAGALRPTDPALLHYRSGAFFLERARQVGGEAGLHDALRDVLLGVVAAAADPISGGRHKVFGREDLAVIPQTSTVASHLPRAVGVAFALGRVPRLGVVPRWPVDSVVVCSFGDASANHSTAVGAINTAANTAFRGLPMPLLLVCEDNGLGISVPTPPGWVEAAYSGRAGLEYLAVDGADLAGTFDAARYAAGRVRGRRRPVFLHLRTVRLMGHAGSDVESAYRTPAEIGADERRDPLSAAARLLVESGLLTPAEVLDRYRLMRSRVRALADEVAGEPRLLTAAAVTAPLAPPDPGAVAAAVDSVRRSSSGAEELVEPAASLTVAQAINRALGDILAHCREALVFGEDVGRKGGVYGVTRGLAARFGAARVFDTVLDEQAILGLAAGAGLSGLLPIAEIQYLAYLHNAEDQIRGEAATLAFFSDGRYRNPMVVRVAAYGYQKGFGGHFHNDDAVAVLRDIPGIVVASPARPDDAAAMLHTCTAAARASGAVCVVLEPIARYHTRDLYEPGDGQWSAPYPPASSHVPIGRGRTYGSGRDLTIATFGNGLFLSLRAARRLQRRGVEARVLDLRWLIPLPVEDLLREASATGRVLVADETRRSGGVSEGVLAALVDHGFAGAMDRVASADSFVPLGDAARLVLLSEDEIVDAAEALVRR